MGDSRTENRKLAAIAFTDIVGYSAMVQHNEKLALELLELHREIIRKIFPKYHGREIKTIGDAFLLEFNSALDAVNSAIEIQEQLKEYNKECNADSHIYVRIGIHVGDIVERDGDVYGDGVNIASRIEPLAHPGGICMSEDVAHQVQNKINVPLEKIGRRQLKNIDEPVEIYQIGLYIDSNAEAMAMVNNRLAVLPFQNFSPDKESDYFSDGLTEELIMHLAGIKELKIVSRTTSMQYKNVQKDMHVIGSELGARYILEGSVRRQRDDLRITAQLIDVSSDSHLWADTFRGNMEDIFDIQENVAKQIVQAMRVTLSPDEEVALSKRATTNTEAFDINLQAREFLFRLTKGYILSAIDLFEQAIALDPKYAAAYAGAGEAYTHLYQFFDKKEEWLEKGMQYALKALMYDPSSSEAYTALGLAYYNKRAFDEANTAIERAIELDPDNFFAYWLSGRINFALDRISEALEQYYKVLELNSDFHSVYGDLRMVYFKLGDTAKLDAIVDESLRFYPNYLLRHPDDARAHIFFAQALQHAGKKDLAMTHMARAVTLSPHESIVMYNGACFYALQGEKELAVEHLKKAVENGYQDFDYIKHDYDFESIRQEPGYLELMKGK